MSLHGPFNLLSGNRMLLEKQHCQASIYMLKVNNRNTRTKWELCSNLPILTPERRQNVVRKTTLPSQHLHAQS